MIFTGIAAGILAGCALSSGTADTGAKARTPEEIKKSGTVRIGVFSDKNPFGYVDENGEIQGYDVYFAKRIAKDLLGSEDDVEFIYVEAANRVEYLKAGKVDTWNPARWT